MRASKDTPPTLESESDIYSGTEVEYFTTLSNKQHSPRTTRDMFKEIEQAKATLSTALVEVKAFVKLI